MELTHIDENGNANMVDVGNKDILKEKPKLREKYIYQKRLLI